MYLTLGKAASLFQIVNPGGNCGIFMCSVNCKSGCAFAVRMNSAARFTLFACTLPISLFSAVGAAEIAYKK
jgi:hypothetical protein